ncbi:MAG: hypothetical protein HYU66_06345 [Armatimonadetes bacterium]|nr:hypothetical protein [Armatimonadota bacterium]
MSLAARWAPIATALAFVLTGCDIQFKPQPRPADSIPLVERTTGAAPARPARPAAPAPPALPAALPPLEPPSGLPIASAAPTPQALSPWTADQLAAAHQAAVERVRGWLAETHRAALLVAEPANYAWLTAGADNRLAADAPPTVLAVLSDQVLVLAPTDTLEAARTALRGLDIVGRTYRWDLGRDPAAPVQALRSLVGDGVIASDLPRPGTENCGDALAELQLALPDPQQQMLRDLSAAVAKAVAEELAAAAASDTEQGLRDRPTARHAALCAEPRDVRVTALDRLAGDGFVRGGSHALAHGVAVHVSAARGGICTTLGRSLVPQPNSAAVDAAVIARRLYAAVLAGVQPGTPLREVAARAAKAAAGAGLPDLFKLFPPGGAGAVQPLARPFSTEAAAQLGRRQAVTLTIRLPQAYLADTFLLSDDRIEPLTVSAAWPAPALGINGRLVPVPTLRGGELEVAQKEQRTGLSHRDQAAFDYLSDTLSRAIEETSKRLSPAPPPAGGAAGPVEQAPAPAP